MLLLIKQRGNRYIEHFITTWRLKRYLCLLQRVLIFPFFLLQMGDEGNTNMMIRCNIYLWKILLTSNSMLCLLELQKEQQQN